MELLTKILLGLFLVTSVTMIVLILLQRGKGSDLGAVFGGGSQSVFGSRGSANFLTRITAVLATVFFGIALSLAYIYTGARTPTSVTDIVTSETIVEEVPQTSDGDAGGELPKLPQ
ncbi:MAG: preprotein translocase subunit SecG [Acidiferrobacterales bacterium]|nr:preprotein translocase subunit SecG [Acidiferrobacterales bacterium]